MGAALARPRSEAGHEVTIVSGPVEVDYPPAAKVICVVSTEEMLGPAGRLCPLRRADRGRRPLRLPARRDRPAEAQQDRRAAAC